MKKGTVGDPAWGHPSPASTPAQHRASEAPRQASFKGGEVSPRGKRFRRRVVLGGLAHGVGDGGRRASGSMPAAVNVRAMVCVSNTAYSCRLSLARAALVDVAVLSTCFLVL